jgi:AraC-like DNA-binding protein
VFGHNDRSALGARKAFEERGARLPMFCGIDALPGPDGGIQQVRDSLLDASYIYPTRGNQLLQLAIDILDGKPFPKETMLVSALVTRDNATVLQLESDEVVRQSQNLDKLQAKAKGYLEQLATQRIISLLALILLALLVLTLVLFILYHRSKVNAQRERIVNNLWNMDAPAETEQPVEQQPETTESSTQPEEDDEEPAKEPLFIIRFKDVVEARLSDSDLSVDDLAAAMNLSRVQLYRKVKAISGSSPVELLRTARLNRGYQLLIKGDKTISEVAYEVGFTAPSYFTKCFKDEFGISPSDLS